MKNRPKSPMPIEEWIDHLDLVLDDYMEEFMSWDHSADDVEVLLKGVAIRTIKRWRRIRENEV